MPRVTFTRDFDCPATAGVFVAYKAGHCLMIPRAHAERARAAGVLLEDRVLDHPPAPAAGDGGAAVAAAVVDDACYHALVRPASEVSTLDGCG